MRGHVDVTRWVYPLGISSRDILVEQDISKRLLYMKRDPRKRGEVPFETVYLRR